MKRLRYTTIKNAVANVMRGCASAGVAVVLPHFLVHALDSSRFSAWSLILQIAAYATYLEFGLQTAIARFLAQAVERGQHERRNRLISTALLLLSCSGLLALLGIGYVLFMLPRFFHGLPGSILGEVQLAGIILGASTALLLPCSVSSGVLVGLQRNEVPAMAIGGSRVIGAIAVVVASYHTHSLVVLALCIALPNLLAGGILWLAAAKLLPGPARRWTAPQLAMIKELLTYCAGLTIFLAAGFLITGLDTTIVAHFAFSQVGYYSIAASVTAVAMGINGAVTNALISPVSVLHARGEFSRIRSTVLTATRFTSAANLLATALLCIYGPYLLRLWVGPVYAQLAYPILVICMFAQVIRQLLGSYCVMLLAAGRQMNAAENAIVEAITNVGTGCIAAAHIGARGVAFGTLVGSICGMTWFLARTLRKECEVEVTPGAFLRAVMPTFLCTGPAFCAWLLSLAYLKSSTSAAALLELGGLLTTLGLLIRYSNLIPLSLLQRFRIMPA